MNYQDFLKQKQLVFRSTGKEIKREDIHPLLFEFQKDLVIWSARKGRAALFADTGLGKALHVDTLVITPDGLKPISEIKVGDQVIGRNGRPTKVIGVYPQGERPAYRITFTDGYSVVCDKDHLWSVRTKVHKYRGQPYRTMTTKEILQDGLTQPSQQGSKWFIPMCQPVEFQSRSLLIDPYLMGVLLGDGGLTTPTPMLSSADEFIVSEVGALLPDGMRTQYRSGYDYSLRLDIGGGHQINPITDAMNEYGLSGAKSENKFIPHDYKFSSIEDREALLQGLLDTDGHVRPKDNNIEYTTVSRQLADDVVWIVQSLGGRATIREKETGYQTAYRMSVQLPNGINPFRLPRKAKVYVPRVKYRPMRGIKSIEPVGTAEMVCIAVDAIDSLFVIEHAIVTHNTFMQLEWARLIGERTLILAPLSVARQTVREAEKLNITVHYTRSGADIIDGINITNYEMMDHFDADDFGAVVLDESSILKAFNGKTRRELTAKFKNTRFKLCCSATPAPNDIIEIGRHSEFLGIMTNGSMLSSFFVHEKSPEFHGSNYRLKGHAEKSFWKWMASWSMSIRLPSDLGYSDDGYKLPPLTITPHYIHVNYIPEGQLFFTHLDGIQGRSKVRQGTFEERCQVAADLVNADNNQWLVWCGLNNESTLLAQLIDGAVEVRGDHSPEEKAERLEAFQDGNTRVLVTKPTIAGFGMNFQNASRMAFVGLDDSYEKYYQAIRRCYRFGQTSPVQVELILADVQQPIYENVLRKEQQAGEMGTRLIENLKEFEKEEILNMSTSDWQYNEDDQRGNGWHLMLGDCSERLDEIAENSIGLILYSPPFNDLFTYSPSERDLGNARTIDEFFVHYREYVIPKIYRALMPGRTCIVHCENLLASKTHHGYIGMIDFRGDIIRAHQAAGWIFAGEITINKNPQVQAIRTKNHRLLFKTMNKDRAKSRPGLADYLLLFEKPGNNEIPITGDDINEEKWIQLAHPVWNHISETNVLNSYPAKREEDEKHICPLQLDLLSDCIKMWSNKGEIVLDPFNGIGSTGHEAIRLNREYIGIELKPEYFNQAVINLKRAETAGKQMTLFTWADMQEKARESLPDDIDNYLGELNAHIQSEDETS